MKAIGSICIQICAVALSAGGAMSGESYVWPAPPDVARFAFVKSIDCKGLSPKAGALGRAVRWLGGATETDRISLPFDLVVRGTDLFLVCQNVPALVQVDMTRGTFRRLVDDHKTIRYPISLGSSDDGTIYFTDSESRRVYRYRKGKIDPFIVDGLGRPTGIAVLSVQRRLFVVDTEDHCLRMFDFDGRLLGRVPREGDSVSFHYPTFAAPTPSGQVLVNDALNYQIKRFDADGNFLGAFGSEGDGPGSFARPKGIGVDGEGHIYVVDNLFDNFQVFDDSGRVLLTIGSAGQEPGQFWSPAGIEITGDYIYIADTFNDRVQVFRYLGAGK
ncbi:MAG: 6-bladed beta-propeller [Candidatus Kerfeldbacteria bacterium]|nr:6-bladed beta-propeller [Candidatus Kerfeldbacteria bacterium]